MIKGLHIGPVALGSIRIGTTFIHKERRLPAKLDHMIITSLAQSGGEWIEHPEMKRLREEEAKANPPEEGKEVKLRSIPVRILFDEPENNFQSNYSCFDKIGRQLCVGDGTNAKRRTANGVEDVSCPGSDKCAFAADHRCKMNGRLIVGLENLFENDPLSGFVVRTTGFNSVKAVQWRLSKFKSFMGGKMAGMPFDLKIRAKSSAGSMWSNFFWFDLEPRGGIFEAARVAQEYRKKCVEHGLDRDALEASVTEGTRNSDFFLDEDESIEVAEEFYLLEDDEDLDLPQSEHGVSCSAEELQEIESLMLSTGIPKDNVFAFLGRPDDSLTSLTPFEAERVIKSLKSVQATSSDQGEARQDQGIPSQSDDGKAVGASSTQESASVPPHSGAVDGNVPTRRQRNSQKVAVAKDDLPHPVISTPNQQQASAFF